MPQAPDTNQNAAPTAGVNGKKDSTAEVPMFDLEEVIQFVARIHGAGLETAKMPDVAVGCGYKHASSTPFYRRMVAGRLFGLLAQTGAELTMRARDYLEPTRDDARTRSLIEAVMAVPWYAEYVGKHVGKKWNPDLVGNEIGRAFTLTDACRRVCAKALESSLRFAGLLSTENTVLAPSTVTGQPSPPPSGDENEDEEQSEETQKHTLFLDKQKKRKFTIIAPISVNGAELTRICKWLEVTMIVEPDTAGPTTL